MKARDVMVSPVVTVKPSTPVKEVARTLLQRHISAVPVVDDDGRLVGIVSEGDLLHRAEAGTERRHSWWLAPIAGDHSLAAEYIKAHGRTAADVMTPLVVTAAPETPLHEIAALLERNAIKRVPIVFEGQVVGIVSRANLVQAVAGAPGRLEARESDTVIREKLLAHLKSQPWADTSMLNVTVDDGVVSLWGIAPSPTEKQAIRVAAESVPGVREVVDHVTLRPPGWGL